MCGYSGGRWTGKPWWFNVVEFMRKHWRFSMDSLSVMVMIVSIYHKILKMLTTDFNWWSFNLCMLICITVVLYMLYPLMDVFEPDLRLYKIWIRAKIPAWSFYLVDLMLMLFYDVPITKYAQALGRCVCVFSWSFLVICYESFHYGA